MKKSKYDIRVPSWTEAVIFAALSLLSFVAIFLIVLVGDILVFWQVYSAPYAFRTFLVACTGVLGVVVLIALVHVVGKRVSAYGKQLITYADLLRASQERGLKIQKTVSNHGTLKVQFAPEEEVGMANGLHLALGDDESKTVRILRIRGIGDYAVTVPKNGTSDLSYQILFLGSVEREKEYAPRDFLPLLAPRERREVSAIFRKYLKERVADS
ncbi:MAG: hypothetical protein WC813_02740 [Patescibacteria group bacterium]